MGVLWAETTISQEAGQSYPIILSPWVDRIGKTEKPEEKYTYCSASLESRVSPNSFLNVANAFNDRIKMLTWADNGPVA